MTASNTELGTGVAVVEKKSQLATNLEYFAPRMAAFLPEGVTMERVIAAVRLEGMKNPDILHCTPRSLVQSCARILQWHLEIGITAYIVPFNVKVKETGKADRWEKQATAIMGYTGMAELMIASGAVRAVQARCVYENDVFDFEYGMHESLVHRPDGSPKTRGALKGAYCILRLARNQGDVFDYMSIEDIDAIRNKHSKQWSAEKVGPCPDWYAKKCAVRQTAKLVPKNPRLAALLAEADAIQDAEFEAVNEPVAELDAPSQPALSAPYDPSWDVDDDEPATVEGELPLGEHAPVRRGVDALREP